METSLTTPATTPVMRVVDWERIEAQYRAGSMSTREIANEHGISHTAINKRAKGGDWSRDLSVKVQAMADAKVSKALVSSLVSKNIPITQKLTVEVESDKVASVRIGHRKTISRGHALCEALLAELEDQTFNAVLIGELGELMRKPDDSGMDRLNDIYKKVTSTSGRVDTAKKLVETMRSVVTMEREAYGIDSKQDDKTESNPLVQLLRDMRRSSLPIVYEVPHDDDL
jgi:hypothetical protein